MAIQSAVRRKEPEPESRWILVSSAQFQKGTTTLLDHIPTALIHGTGLPAGLAGIKSSGRRIGFSDVGHIGFFGMESDRATSDVIQRSKRLWIAVLHQAIEDAKGNVRSIEKSERSIGGIQREALIWIFHGISNAANSFNSICGLLDIDPDRARQRLRVVPGIRRGLDRTQQGVGEGEG